jgi:uncharacterized protein (TIGR02284 family)
METTREAAQQKVHDNTVSTLNELLEKSYDAEKGYKQAIENSHSPKLKNFFQERAAQRSQFATELHEALHQLNAEPTTKGSTAGTFHRAWMDLKASVFGDNEESVLEECIRGEKASLDEYKDALDGDTLLADVVPVVQNQMAQIKSTLDTVEKLEDLN